MKYDDTALERLMREGLQARADRLDLAVPEVSRGRRPAPWGRPTVWLTAAAAAAVAIGTPFAWQALNDPPAQTPITSAGEVPDSWRAESYGGVQVMVPPEWVQGSNPMPDEGPAGRPDSGSWCGGPMPSAYVGRPVMLSDACFALATVRMMPPSVDSVWFGAPNVSPGVNDFGNGFVQETVEVGGVTVAVTTDDPALRAEILSTAEAVDVDANGCRTQIDGPPWAETTDPPASAPLSVCVYDVDPDLTTTLIWSGSADAAAAAAYFDAVEAARGTGDDVAACKRAAEGEWVAIGTDGPEGVAWDAVDFACQKVMTAGGDVALSRAIVEPWASDGTRAYVAGPFDGDWSGLFRGMLG